MIEGINHVTLSVRALDRSFAFCAEVLGLGAVARWDGGAYLSTGGDWVALILYPNAR